MMSQLDIFWVSVAAGMVAWCLGCFCDFWRRCWWEVEHENLHCASFIRAEDWNKAWMVRIESDTLVTKGRIVDSKIVWDAKPGYGNLEIYTGAPPADPTSKPTGMLIGRVYGIDFGKKPTYAEKLAAYVQKQQARPSRVEQ